MIKTRTFVIDDIHSVQFVRAMLPVLGFRESELSESGYNTFSLRLLSISIFANASGTHVVVAGTPPDFVAAQRLLESHCLPHCGEYRSMWHLFNSRWWIVRVFNRARYRVSGSLERYVFASWRRALHGS